MTILTPSSVTPVTRTVTANSGYRAATSLVSAAPSAPVSVPVAESAPRLEEVQQAIERFKQSIKPTLANNLEFEIDQSSGKTLVKILDKETNKIVRQIPSEEMLVIARALDRMQGRGGLVKQQA